MKIPNDMIINRDNRYTIEYFRMRNYIFICNFFIKILTLFKISRVTYINFISIDIDTWFEILIKIKLIWVT